MLRKITPLALRATSFAPVRFSHQKSADEFLKEREHAFEDMYFNKEEKELLAKLLKKAEKQVAAGGTDGKAKAVASALEKHGIKPTAELVRDIIKH